MSQEASNLSQVSSQALQTESLFIVLLSVLLITYFVKSLIKNCHTFYQDVISHFQSLELISQNRPLLQSRHTELISCMLYLFYQ